MELPDGRWGAFEIKLGTDKIDDAANNLIGISKMFEDRGGRVPTFLCIICGVCKGAFRRDDGVYVVPITSLRE